MVAPLDIVSHPLPLLYVHELCSRHVCCMFVASRFLLLQDALTKARHYVSVLLLHRKPSLLSDTTIRTKFQTTDPVNETISAHEDHVLDVGSVVLCQCVCVCVCVTPTSIHSSIFV